MKPPRPRLLVTRPKGQEKTLVADCEALGFAVVHLPCLDIQATDKQIEAIDLADVDAVVFTSANAVAYANQKLSLPWTEIDAYALGDATVNALKALGQSVISQPAPPYNSEAFVRLLQQQSSLPDRLLIVKGVGGRGYIEAQLEPTATEVITVDVYQRQCPTPDATLAIKLSTPFDIISVMSNETLDNLVHLASPLLGTLLQHDLIVNSERTRQHAQQSGFTGNVFVAPHAGNSGQLEVLSNWLADRAKRTNQ